jgi:hypothetical protein
MRASIWLAAIIVACCCASAARAGISLSSYDTVAQANAYAPLSRDRYYLVDRHPDASPAVADVSADWTGTNVGGSTATWHMTVSAHAQSATVLSTSGLTIMAAGSFGYDLSTTADFIDPTSITTHLVPGGGGGYQGFFSIDYPATYALSAQLGHYAGVNLSSLQTGVIYQRTNLGTLPVAVDQIGTIAPGQYQIGASVGFHIPNLPNGINHLTDNGTLSNFFFSARVPEPALAHFMTSATASVILTRRRRN